MFRRTMLWGTVLGVLSGVAFAGAGTLKGNSKSKSLPPTSSGMAAPAAKVLKSISRSAVMSAAVRALAHPAGPAASGGLANSLQQKSLTLPVPAPAPAPGLNVIWSKAAGVPRSIHVMHQQRSSATASIAAYDPLATAKVFLGQNKGVLRIKNPDTEFAVMSSVQDAQGITHIRFHQLFAGVEVWASDVYLHVRPQDGVTLFNGTYHPTPELASAAPGITAAQALTAASGDLASRGELQSLAPNVSRLLQYAGPVTKEVVWYDTDNVPHLTWFVEIRTGLDRDWYYFVDANTGSVLHRYDNTQDDGPATANGTDLNGVQQSFGTYAVGSEYYLVDAAEPMFNAGASQIPQNPIGAIAALDLRGRDLSAQDTMYYVFSSNNTWSDASSISAQYNAARTYNFYRQVFARNSIDDKGMTIYSIIHVTSNGQPMDNAFWSGGVMCYGDGNTAFKPLAGGFDVAAHEMTHGVTEHSAGLVYQDQAGALNESMSDVFASVLDSSNWTIGEQVMKDFTTYPSGALRDLSNPHNGGNSGDPCWQPATMAEFVNTTEDHGGVHTNSGIPNNAFYRVATSIGRSKASAVWYKALTNYLTSSAQFIDARIATEEAAKSLFGDPSTELAAVKNGWDGVQVFEGAGTPPPPTSQLVGTNWMLAVNTSSSDPNSLYKIKPVIQSNADFFPLSMTPVLTRPAVSDTSGLVVFIDGNNDLRVLSANASNPGESKLDSSGVWWSVALGPGLSSLALTSKYVDTTIYYFDVLGNQTKQFKIRTTAYDGAATGTALYADAMTFDPTGRYLLFDAFNRTRTAQGDTLSFWTIDMLDVQTGDMRSVFPPQPEGIDIGNPSFSKTSGYRFTFDYWDTKAGNGYVLAADIFRGDIGQVAGPLPTPGYPTYSGDDGVIAFHTLTSVSSALHDDIQEVALDTSRIVGTGSPSDYLVDATFPVWFVVGSRVTAVENPASHDVPTATALLQNYPNPFNPSTRIGYSLPARSNVKLTVFNTLGQQVAVLVQGVEQAGYHEVQFNGSGLASGVYFYRLDTGSATQTKKLILLR